MGAVSGLGRCVLIIVNTISFIVAVGLVACGCVIKYVLGSILKSDVIDIVGETVFTLFVRNSAVPKSIDFGLLTDGVGTALIVIGVVLGVLSLLGCWAACCKFRVLLILFAVCLGVIAVSQIVGAAVILPHDSVIHKTGKEKLKETLDEDYDRVHINSFTISADIIFLAAQCCGVYGARDFEGHKNLQFNDTRGNPINPIVPPSCCRREYIEKLDWNCAKDSSYNMTYTEGCYEKLQDVIEGWYPWLITALIISIAVQVGEMVLAILVAKDAENFVI